MKLQSFRRIFLSAFLEELETSSVSAFGKWPFESYTSNSFLAETVLSRMAHQWSDCTRRIEAVTGIGGQEEVSEQLDDQLQDTTPGKRKRPKTSSASKRLKSDSVKGKPPSKQPKNTWSDAHLNALDRCVGLLGLLSAIPSGYIKSSECALCAYTLLCFERYCAVPFSPHLIILKTFVGLMKSSSAFD